jgi:hypothetical protein
MAKAKKAPAKKRAKAADPRAAAVKAICAALGEGKPLAHICREAGMPGLRTVYDWMDADPEIAARIARAREDGEDMLAADCLTIADDMLDHPTSRKVRVWARLELLKRWNPKKYGDRVQHADAEGNKLEVPQFVVMPIAPKAE